jgi:tRNA pseudouridine32 synthase
MAVPLANDIPPILPNSELSSTSPENEIPAKAPIIPPTPETTEVIPKKKTRVRQKLSHEVIVTPCTGPGRYYISDDLRRVEPYFWTYNTFAKGRWLGRPILDIFASEMRDREADYYRHAIETGHIIVNGKPVEPETILKNGDMITHTLHRHEPPVTKDEVGIVAETDELLVINKPAGVPVHPAGRYHFNSVMEILRAQYNGAFNPRPANRLDRLTSGIMFVGKTAPATDAFTAQLRGRTIRKEYVARVLGEFPEEIVVCGQPILQISPKLGLNAVRANGKEARTIFKRLAYYPPSPTSSTKQQQQQPEQDKNTHPTNSSNPSHPPLPWRTHLGHSIVRCYPLTGRTHQLRVHLQFLGHPISNDPIYANQRVFGPNLWASHSCDSSVASGTNSNGTGTGANSNDELDADEAVLQRLERMGKSELASAVAYYDDVVDTYHARKAERLTGAVCGECAAPLYSDPGAHELGIYLHARRYASADGAWAYETELPAWALPPEGMTGPTSVEGSGEIGEEVFEREREELEKSVLPRAGSGGMVGVVGSSRKVD